MLATETGMSATRANSIPRYGQTKHWEDSRVQSPVGPGDYLSGVRGEGADRG